ncbi:unnamed protein product [Schistocephalus solidus]|uniref:RUN domain-containing protein n=1 Tax=Schistocephalus solidus TaxID=70667 RepID=A0A183SM87_SCHSO|nr:unnamed protein product [Schistocephalus solidus]
MSSQIPVGSHNVVRLNKDKLKVWLKQRVNNICRFANELSTAGERKLLHSLLSVHHQSSASAPLFTSDSKSAKALVTAAFNGDALRALAFQIVADNLPVAVIEQLHTDLGLQTLISTDKENMAIVQVSASISESNAQNSKAAERKGPTEDYSASFEISKTETMNGIAGRLARKSKESTYGSEEGRTTTTSGSSTTTTAAIPATTTTSTTITRTPTATNTNPDTTATTTTTPWDPSQMWWYAERRLRPCQPPVPSPISGLLDSVLTPGIAKIFRSRLFNEEEEWGGGERRDEEEEEEKEEEGTLLSQKITWQEVGVARIRGECFCTDPQVSTALLIRKEQIGGGQCWSTCELTRYMNSSLWSVSPTSQWTDQHKAGLLGWFVVGERLYPGLVIRVLK